MPVRMPRGISARAVEAGETKVIALRNIYQAEDLGRMGGPIHAATVPTTENAGTAYAFLGPAGFVEANFTALFIPSEVVRTYAVHPDKVPTPPSDPAEWDLLCRRLLLEFGTDGNEYYGANPDDRAFFDANANTWFRTRPASSQTSSDAPAATADDVKTVNASQQDEPMMNGTMGPLGIQRLLNMEVLLSPTAVQGPTRNLVTSIIGTLFGQGVGYTDLTHGFSASWEVTGPVRAPGVIALCCTRYDVPRSATTSWSGTYHEGATSSGSDGLTAPQQAQVNRALNQLYGGDLERVQADLRYDQGFRGQWLRSELFGGDQYLEAPGSWSTTLFGTEGIFGIGSSPTWLRPNVIVVATKWNSSILTPYTTRIS